MFRPTSGPPSIAAPEANPKNQSRSHRPPPAVKSKIPEVRRPWKYSDFLNPMADIPSSAPLSRPKRQPKPKSPNNPRPRPKAKSVSISNCDTMRSLASHPSPAAPQSPFFLPSGPPVPATDSLYSAQAISSTMPVVAINTHSGVRNFPPQTTPRPCDPGSYVDPALQKTLSPVVRRSIPERPPLSLPAPASNA